MQISQIACAHCGRSFSYNAPGTKHRNHCPFCLWSLHRDQPLGDRASDCGGAMAPLAISVRHNGEWEIIHRCNTCGVIHANRIAGDDAEVSLLSIAVKPLAKPPFPLEFLNPHG